MPDDKLEAAPAATTEGAQAAQPTETTTGEVSTTTQTQTTPTDSKPVEEAFDFRSNYDSLNKNYGELRKWATQQSQARADLEKKLDLITDQFSKLTEEKIDPAKFIADLQAQGPYAFDPYLQKRIDSHVGKVRAEYDKTLGEMQDRIRGMEINTVIEGCKKDSKNYPDFDKLENTMNDILNSPNNPVRLDQPVNVVVDALYRLARNQHSQEAIQMASKEAYSKAQHDLATEAKAAVATGATGGTGSPVDYNKMSVQQMRDSLNSQLGSIDRD
jgi:hypothetical protein